MIRRYWHWVVIVAVSSLAMVLDVVDPVGAEQGGDCPSNQPIVVKWNDLLTCSPDGDNSLHLWYPSNFGPSDVQDRCNHLGGHAHRFHNHGGHYMCINIDH